MSEISTATWIPAPGQADVGISADRLRELQRPVTATTSNTLPGSSEASIETQLFDSLSRSATLLAGLSMHLPASWRQDAIEQMRTLLSLEAWDDDSNLLDVESTKTFLRFVIFGNVRRIPSLGISNRRRLTAAWTWPARKLFMEFSAGDHCRAVYSFPGQFEAIRQAMDGNIGDAVGVLARNGFDLATPTPTTHAN